MATTPRGKSSSGRATTRTRKPATIDLDAKDIKDNSAPDIKPGSDKLKKVPGEKSATDEKIVRSTHNQDTIKKASPPKQAVPKVAPKTRRSDAANTADKKEAKTDKGPSNAKSAGAKAKPAPSNVNPALVKNTDNGIGLGKLAAAGIVGGLITLGGAGAMQYSGLLPDFGPETPIVETPVVDLEPLQAKIAQLQSKIEVLQNNASQAENSPNAPVAGLNELIERIAKLENAPAPLLSGDNTGADNSGQLQVIRDELSKQTQILSQRLATLEEKNSDTPDITTLTSIVNTAIAPIENNLKTTTGKLVQMETVLARLNEKVTSEVDARIDAFEKKLDNAATGEKLAKSVALNALKSAFENGQPFTAALTSLETLAGTSDPIEKLKPFATNGIATNRQLRDEFHQIQGKILSAATNDPDASLTDRLMVSIQSLVTVSSSEPLPGGSAQAIISRINANLKSENFGGAISEWKTLPDPARQISKSWAEKLSQRLDADRQIHNLMKNLQAGE